MSVPVGAFAEALGDVPVPVVVTVGFCAPYEVGTIPAGSDDPLGDLADLLREVADHIDQTKPEETT